MISAGKELMGKTYEARIEEERAKIRAELESARVEKTVIEKVVDGLRKILAAHSRYANIEVELYFNEKFTTDIYLPLIDEIDELNDDNDLFMRAMNLASLAEEHRVKTATCSVSSTTSIAASTPATPVVRTRRGENKEVVLNVLASVVKAGKMTSALLNDLKKSSYSKTHFKMPTYPILVSVADFTSTNIQIYFCSSKSFLQNKPQQSPIDEIGYFFPKELLISILFCYLCTIIKS